MRRQRTRGSKWARGFDWDAASFSFAIQQGEIFADWARVPSGATDPLAGDIFIRAKTLVKTLVFPHLHGPITAANTTFQANLGLIAWDGEDATPPAGGFPSPGNGAVDWIWWLPIGAYNPTSFATTTWNSSFLEASYTGGVYSSAMRKLPESKGLLFVMHYLSGPASPGGIIGVDIQFRMGLKGDVTAPGLGTQ